MTQKNFSSRINMAAFKEMGFDMAEGMHDGLEQMDDDKSDDEKEDDNEKHDGQSQSCPLLRFLCLVVDKCSLRS